MERLHGMFAYQAVVIPLLRLTLAALMPFHKKVRQRRMAERSLLSAASERLCSESRPRVMFHAASMGELEQLLPIIELLRESEEQLCIVATCSSPSGVSHAQKQICIDHALYLPIDSKRSIHDFFDVIQPSLVVIDRYDVWPMCVAELAQRNVPVVLINATLPSAAKLPLLGAFVRSTYRLLTSVTAVTESDATALSTLVNHQVAWLPDTRMDRVLQRVEASRGKTSLLPPWSGDTLVIGSSWPEDEKLLLHAWTSTMPENWRLVIVPHEPTESALQSIEGLIPCRRLSKINLDEPHHTTPHILVDRVGILVELYAAASAAYVGGGFGAGVHSMAEPAGFGLPIACGPRIQRSRDAGPLTEAGAAMVLQTPREAEAWLSSIQDVSFRTTAAQASYTWVSERVGSSRRYVELLRTLLPTATSSNDREGC